jgi:hypothetical protein
MTYLNSTNVKIVFTTIYSWNLLKLNYRAINRALTTLFLVVSSSSISGVISSNQSVVTLISLMLETIILLLT